jgi:hypothetical protein
MKATERQFYLGVIALLAFVILLLRACSPGKQKPCEELKDFAPIEVTRTDTVVRIVKDSTKWQKPTLEKNSREAQEAPELSWNDRIYLSSGKNVSIVSQNDSLLICNDSVDLYSNTFEIPEGKITVESKVKDSQLVSQRVKADIKQMTVEKFTERTIFKELPPKTQLYFGLLAQGDKVDLLSGFGTSLLLKTKRDKLYEVSALYGMNGKLMFQAGTLFKLSFK